VQTLYVGPLLIVMDAGFGIYDGGRSVAPEERVLASVSSRGTDSEGLTRTAVDAVDLLMSSGALRSKDVKTPFVAVLPVRVRRGAVARLTVRSKPAKANALCAGGSAATRCFCARTDQTQLPSHEPEARRSERAQPRSLPSS
jgi:hypothetical protein